MYPLDQSSERLTMQKNRLMESISYRVCITAFDLRITALHVTQNITEFGILSSPFVEQMTTTIAHLGRTCNRFHRPDRHEHSKEGRSQ